MRECLCRLYVYNWLLLRALDANEHGSVFTVRSALGALVGERDGIEVDRGRAKSNLAFSYPQ